MKFRTFRPQRIFIAAIALVFLVLPGVSAAQDEVTITFSWPFGTAVDAMEEISQEFSEMNPRINVEFQPISYDAILPTMTTGFIADDAPDVITMSPAWITQFSAAGWLEDLDPWLEESGLEETLLPISMVQGRMYQNTGYMIGALIDTYVMYYNTDHFEAAGIEAFPATIDEFSEVVNQLTDADNNQYGYYLFGNHQVGFQPWSMWMLVSGGIGPGNTLYTEDGQCIFRTDAHIEGMDKFLALYRDDGASPPASATAGSNDGLNAFAAGNVSVINTFLGALPTVVDTLGEDSFNIASMPGGTAGVFTHYGVNGFSMKSNTEYKEESWEFIEYLLQPEVNARYNGAWGTLPVVIEALDAEYLQKPYFEAAIAQVQDANLLVNTPRELPGWGDFFVNYAPEHLQRALLGETTAEEFVDTVCTRLEEIRADEVGS